MLLVKVKGLESETCWNSLNWKKINSSLLFVQHYNYKMQLKSTFPLFLLNQWPQINPVEQTILKSGISNQQD